MFRSRHARQLDELTAAAARIEASLARVEDALDLRTPGGLAAVRAEARDARSAAEAAAGGLRALAGIVTVPATTRPGSP